MVTGDDDDDALMLTVSHEFGCLLTRVVSFSFVRHLH